MATVLVIDDEKDICQCVEVAFNEEAPEFSVLKADNGLDGLELVKKHKPDVILLDVKLQASMDGMEVFKKIKELHPEGKVAILTGYEENKEEFVRDFGVDAFMVKPFTPLEVIALVRKLFREKERRR